MNIKGYENQEIMELYWEAQELFEDTEEGKKEAMKHLCDRLELPFTKVSRIVDQLS